MTLRLNSLSPTVDPMSKQRLVHWVVDATTKVYSQTTLHTPQAASPQGQYLLELSAHTNVLRNELLTCACMSLTTFVTLG